MDTQDLIAQEDDKLYKNPNADISMSDLTDKTDNSQSDNNKEQSEGEESKDQDQDPKPDNNVNLQTGEQSSLNNAQKEELNQKNKSSQWSHDGEYLDYTNYLMNSNQSQF